MFYRLFSLLWALTLFCAVTASQSPVEVAVRNSPGKTTSDTLRAIRRYLYHARVQGREAKFSNSTSLDKSFNNAVLFRFEHSAEAGKVDVSAQGGIKIVCTRCYIKGRASAHLTVDGTFNATQVAKDIGNEFEETFDNITTYAKDYVSGVAKKLADGLDADDFDFPPLNVTFDVDVPEFPSARLGFGFDGLELYMQLDTTLSAGLTYTLNLYTSTTPLGSKIGNDLLLGVVFAVDLILSVESEIQMSSGFHIRMDDGVGFDISLFSKNVSSVNFNGGQFEFLPVVIESAGAVLKAILRIGISAGIEISSPVDSTELEIFDQEIKIPGASAGIQVGVFANIAELSTNVTALSSPDPAADGDGGCLLRAVNAYQFALGAAAGASVQIGDRIWGPVPNTQIPIFYTTLADGCASRRAPPPTTAVASVSSSATITTTTTAAASTRAEGDEELTTTTLSEKVTYTGIECLTTGLVNCPPQLQTLRKFVATETFVTAVAAGVKATFPAATQAVVQEVVDFGSGAESLTSTSGVPKAFTPVVSVIGTGTNPADVFEGEIGGVDKKVIIGVSIGAGVAVLAGAIGICM
ncbi:hypothetical protein CH35J_006353 [Colletotrichum higginsianum]|uniref:Uncharacterized protein n=1 Tax=Colletotrichum higginsianum TaxID=80884 RepID=A0A4T0W3Z7_9PEZI|nr:hypothetical protein CH35J_006353 [Colletotrichum higginsianum]